MLHGIIRGYTGSYNGQQDQYLNKELGKTSRFNQLFHLRTAMLTCSPFDPACSGGVHNACIQVCTYTVLITSVKWRFL